MNALHTTRLYVYTHPLRAIIFFGLCLRLLFIFTSNHVYYPDEILQTLEQSFRLIHGYGLIPWEYIYGIRSWLLPLLLAVPLKVFSVLGINQPFWYSHALSSLLTVLSLVVIPCCYEVVKAAIPHKRTAHVYGLVAAFLAAIWYELIYFAPRALSETVAMYALAASVWLLLTQVKKHTWLAHTTTRLALAGFFAGMGIVLRPQYFPLAFIAIVFWGRTNGIRSVNRFVFGVLVAILLGGAVDLFTLGAFWGSLTEYASLEFGHSISQVFGSQPPWYYFQALLITSGGLLVVALASLTNKRSWWLWAGYLALLISHSLVAHKEYRFILIAIPLQLALAVLGLSQMSQWFKSAKDKAKLVRLGVITATALSLAGIAHSLPGMQAYYPKPLLWQDPMLATFNQLHQQPQLCGVFDQTQDWPTSPSYYFLNRPVPLYTQDTPPTDWQTVSHLFASLDETGSEVQLLTQSDFDCIPDNNYSYFRTLEYVEKLIN